MKPRAALLSVILALALVAPPTTSSGQQPGQVYRIGWLGTGVPVFRQNCVRLAWRRSVLLGEAQHAGRLIGGWSVGAVRNLQAISPRIKR